MEPIELAQELAFLQHQILSIFVWQCEQIFLDLQISLIQLLFLHQFLCDHFLMIYKLIYLVWCLKFLAYLILEMN